MAGATPRGIKGPPGPPGRNLQSYEIVAFDTAQASADIATAVHHTTLAMLEPGIVSVIQSFTNTGKGINYVTVDTSAAPSSTSISAKVVVYASNLITLMPAVTCVAAPHIFRFTFRLAADIRGLGLLSIRLV